MKKTWLVSYRNEHLMLKVSYVEGEDIKEVTTRFVAEMLLGAHADFIDDLSIHETHLWEEKC